MGHLRWLEDESAAPPRKRGSFDADNASHSSKKRRRRRPGPRAERYASPRSDAPSRGRAGDSRFRGNKNPIFRQLAAEQPPQTCGIAAPKISHVQPGRSSATVAPPQFSSFFTAKDGLSPDTQALVGFEMTGGGPVTASVLGATTSPAPTTRSSRAVARDAPLQTRFPAK